jgi:hypothetical protein
MVLFEETAVKFQACDMEDLPVASQIPSQLDPRSFTAELLDKAEDDRLVAESVVEYTALGLYTTFSVAPTLGDFVVKVYLGGEAVGSEIEIHTLCPTGYVPVGDGRSCGCMPGTYFEADMCKPCLPGTYSGRGETFCRQCGELNFINRTADASYDESMTDIWAPKGIDCPNGVLNGTTPGFWSASQPLTITRIQLGHGSAAPALPRAPTKRHASAG